MSLKEIFSKKILQRILQHKKLLLGFTCIIVGGAALYVTFGSTDKAAAEYLTSMVQKGVISDTISASGTIEPVTTVSMSFKSAEIVKKLYVEEGDRVTTGQLLAELETDNLEASVQQAQASVTSAQANLNLLQKGASQEDIDNAQANIDTAQVTYDTSKTTLERNKALFDAGAISQADYDNYETDLKKAEAQLKQAKASLASLLKGEDAENIQAAQAQVSNAQAQLNMKLSDLEAAKLISPTEGIVSSISGAEGQRASANNDSTSGGGFMDIISEELQIAAQVNESDIGNVKVGQKATFTVNSFPDEVFGGTISSISPIATTESNVQVYDVVIKMDESYEGLKAGMPTDVTIILEQQEGVLIVPKSAMTFAKTYATSALPKPGENAAVPEMIKEKGEQMEVKQKQVEEAEEKNIGKAAMVLVMDKNGKLETRNVQLGISDLTNYEVLGGLQEGEVVVSGSSSTTVENGNKTESNNNNRGGGMRMGGGGGPPM